jgi:U32 family peptidase
MQACDLASSMKIVAPACSLEDAQAALAAGADELYVGVMPEAWTRAFGDGDGLTRRQGAPAHVQTMQDLKAIAKLGAASGRTMTLVMNARYSAAQEPHVCDLLQRWEDMGGAAVMVADPGILMVLHQRGSRLRRHLSLLAGVFNRESVQLFAQWGVTRIVLPRDLTIAEVAAITSGDPAMEYEMVGLFQKCVFIDGFCGFRHSMRFPADVPGAFAYQRLPQFPLPVVWSDDPDYEGHGCQVAWQTEAGSVQCDRQNDFVLPSCAACSLPALAAANVRYVKIAGRGYPLDMVIRGIRFLHEALRLHGSRPAKSREVLELYARAFGAPCHEAHCYFEGA